MVDGGCTMVELVAKAIVIFDGGWMMDDCGVGC